MAAIRAGAGFVDPTPAFWGVKAGEPAEPEQTRGGLREHRSYRRTRGLGLPFRFGKQ